MEDREKEIKEFGCRKKRCIFLDETNLFNFCGAVFCKKYCGEEKDYNDNCED